MPSESPVDYAQRRANETNTAYIISDDGHVMTDDCINRYSLGKLGQTIAYRLTPTTWEFHE